MIIISVDFSCRYIKNEKQKFQDVFFKKKKTQVLRLKSQSCGKLNRKSFGF